jgi:integrase
MDTTHLKLKHRTWFVRLRVPPTLQTIIGKTEVLQSLKTHDLKQANKLKHRVIAEMQESFTRAAATAVLPRDAADAVLIEAQQLRAAVARGEVTREDAEVVFDANLERHLETQARLKGINPADGHPVLDEAHERVLQLAHHVFTTGNTTLLSKCIADYLKETGPRVRVGTLNEKRRQLGEFAGWIKGDIDVATITKKMAGRYVADVLLTKGHAPKTVKDTLSNLSAFFVWLEGRGEVESNPWRGMSATVKGSTRGAAAKRRPWADDELLKLLEGLPESDVLLPLTAIAAYTGMRIDEVASMRAKDATVDALRVVAGKTSAAVRYVPVHAAIKPMVAQLLKHSSDGYLLPGLLSGGADAKRGHLVGKRFGVTIRRLGFADQALTFHTLRNAFMQRCEAAGVPESTTKLLVGHARQSLTYGLYSPGIELKLLTEAVQSISYGKADALVRSLGSKLAVETKSRRRFKRAAQ